MWGEEERSPEHSRVLGLSNWQHACLRQAAHGSLCVSDCHSQPRDRTAGRCVDTRVWHVSLCVCPQSARPGSLVGRRSPPLSHSAQLPAIRSLGPPWASCCPRCQADRCLSHARCPSGPEGWKQAKERGKEGRKGSDRPLGNIEGLDMGTLELTPPWGPPVVGVHSGTPERRNLSNSRTIDLHAPFYLLPEVRNNPNCSVSSSFLHFPKSFHPLRPVQTVALLVSTSDSQRGPLLPPVAV